MLANRGRSQYSGEVTDLRTTILRRCAVLSCSTGTRRQGDAVVSASFGRCIACSDQRPRTAESIHPWVFSLRASISRCAMRIRISLLEDSTLCCEESGESQDYFGFWDQWHVDEADKLHRSLAEMACLSSLMRWQ